MFNTLGTTKILEIKKFLQSYEGCQMYWMVWGYTIIKDTNEKWQWMPKKKKTLIPNKDESNLVAKNGSNKKINMKKDINWC